MSRARMRRAARGRGKAWRRRSRPAFALSLIGGILILLNGVVIAIIGAIIASVASELGIELAVIGFVFGLIVLVGAIVWWSNPNQHVAWGVVILLFSLFSIVIGGVPS